MVAEKVAAFREDFDEALTVADVLDWIKRCDGDLEHRYDFAIGDLAAENENCTDSREYRLASLRKRRTRAWVFDLLNERAMTKRARPL